MNLMIQAATVPKPSAPRGLESEKTPFAFVLAHSFSGSTLLSFLLAVTLSLAIWLLLKGVVLLPDREPLTRG